MIIVYIMCIKSFFFFFVGFLNIVCMELDILFVSFSYHFNKFMKITPLQKMLCKNSLLMYVGCALLDSFKSALTCKSMSC